MARAPHFRIETAQSGSEVTIKLTGELDSATYAELLERFEQAVGGSRARELILDLADVSFIDSSGMRAIIAIERGAGERGVALRILPPPEPLTEMLEVAGLTVRLAPRAEDAPPSGRFVERVEFRLPREPTAPSRARAELREAVGERLGEADRATLTLLTSELVTNAVIHPDPGVGPTIGLQITTYRDRVRVEVTDSGSGFDVATLPPRPRETGGHGLLVVEGLSSRWGTRRMPADGFCVWFELETEHPLATPAAGEPADTSVTAAGG